MHYLALLSCSPLMLDPELMETDPYLMSETKLDPIEKYWELL